MSLEDTVTELIQGSIDMHVHASPSLFQRSGDDIDLVKNAKMAGMKGVVIKAHHGNSADRAQIVQKAIGQGKFYVIGGLVLNSYCGGLNPDAVEAAIKLGAKIIWMPTVSSENHIKYYGSNDYSRDKIGTHLGKCGGISILNKMGQLLPEVESILQIIVDNDVCLATGHISNSEINVLCKRALKMNIKKILITHPDFETNRMSLQEQKYYAEKGILLEKTFLETSPSWNGITPQEMARGIEFVGAENCIMTSDYGQKNNVSPVEGMKQFIRTMLQNNIKPKQIELMVKENPIQLLNL